jgi:PAS domain S-box-containing protein
MSQTAGDVMPPEQAGLPDATQARARILLVDDRPDKLLALESVLTDLGQDVVTATSGREALKRLLGEDFAVILLDVNMPGMDGFETAALIRQRPRSEKTPIIFVTAMSDTETHVSRGYSLGAVDYIRAPVDPEVLKTKVAVFVDLFNRTERVKRQAERMRVIQETRLAAVHDKLEAETRRNRFFTLAVDMLAIAGFDGHFRQLNPAWEKALGFSAAELLARPLIECVHPDDRPQTALHLDGLMERAQNGGVYFENRCRHQDGGWRWVGWTAVPFAEEGLIYVFARDITALKVAEEERLRLGREQSARQVAEAAERRAAFLAEAGVALTSTLDERAVLASLARLAVPTLAEWCVVDVRDEDGVLRRLEAVHADEERADLMERVRGIAPEVEGASPQARALATGELILLPHLSAADLGAMGGSAEHARALAELAPRALVVAPLCARDRCFGVMTLGLAVPSLDASDLRLAEDLATRAALAADNAMLYRQAQDARQAAERANRAKDEFLATLSHELRTPLTPILGWAVMLRTGGLDREGVERGLTIIERNVRTQTQLIEDLLDVSRIITGKLRVEMRPIALGPVVEAGLESVRPSAEAKQIALVTHLAARDARVLGDPDRLQQVVWNLASNAVKFTGRGGRVDVTLAEEDGSVKLTVADNGRGIAPDFLGQVFDRFRQADSTSTRKYGGLGLGLAIVRHLVELHGGSVYAHSEGLDRGSVFTVQLPLPPPAALDDGAAATPAAETGEDMPLRLDGLRVMVVDDEPDLREFLTVSLRRHGAEVTAYAGAEEAYHALVQRAPDVLVSDIAMKGQDGYEFIRRVRALAAAPASEVPAAALTAHAGGEDGARALEAGFHVHLPKPVDPARLIHTVASLARRAGGLGPA